MSGRAGFEIGCEVVHADGSTAGKLARLVVDPVARSVTHVVVEPSGEPRVARLVPVKVVEECGPPVRLGASAGDLDRFEEAEETRFLPGDSAEWGGAPGEVLSWPYFGLGGAGVGWMGAGALGTAGTEAIGPQAVVYDRVPAGEVDVRRGEPVHASDGAIGRVQGLVVDSENHVTHVLLDEGHLWGHKRVAIPISAVTSVDEGVHVSLSKSEVKELPGVELDPEKSP